MSQDGIKRTLIFTRDSHLQFKTTLASYQSVVVEL